MATVVVIVKPDAWRRGLQGTISRRFAAEFGDHTQRRWFCKGHPGLKQKFTDHYAEHRGKDFYADLVDAVAKGPIDVYYYKQPKTMSVGR